jgi:pyrroline-5-carboxylate reductase
MKLRVPVGFIGGGNMAEAMIQGLLAAKTIVPSDCWVCDIIEDRLTHLKSKYGVMAVSDTPQVIRSSRAVILAVKPQNMEKALTALAPLWSKEKLLISIAAGVPISYIEGFFEKKPKVVRVMPNTPALVLAGISALAKNEAADEKDLALAESLFQAIGETVRVEESQLDAVTGLSGSGPAYVFSFLEGLIEGGLKMGLPRSVAQKLAVQTVLGAAQMARKMDWPISQLKEMVTSPGGTTIHGLHVMEKAGFHGILMEAVEAATRRSRELGQALKKGS